MSAPSSRRWGFRGGGGLEPGARAADIGRLTPGFQFHPAALDRDQQNALAAQVMALSLDAPFYEAVTPGGQPMSVRMTGFGATGWYSDRSGYRYEDLHPVTGRPRPPIPQTLIDLWRRLAPLAPLPDACLVNWYGAQAKMGLHQDKDEADLSAPVLSVSLGDTAIFRIGGTVRGGKTASLRLSSGDVCLLGGEARLAYHGVDRVLAGSSTVVPGGGRLNLTLRKAR
jgi:alkylated DNA repair protein (DNA oxidative demethylase)